MGPGQRGKMSTKISVITPSLNSAKYLRGAIDSVKSQSYTDWEHIVMDGGSTDGTLDILKACPWVRWVSEPDSGQSNAMNKGFGLAEGEIVVYLNADDYFLPEAFGSVVAAFSPTTDVVVGDVIVQDLDGTETRVSPKVSHLEMLRHWEPWYEELGVTISPFPNNPVQYFYRRSIQEAFPFNEGNHNSMDLEFLLRVSKHHPFAKIDAVLGVYRLLEEAKNVVAQKAAYDYWTCSNFSYVDEVIADWSAAEIQSFKSAQQEGYLDEAQRAAQWSFRPVADAMDRLMKSSLLTSPMSKVRSYKALLSALISYRRGLG